MEPVTQLTNGLFRSAASPHRTQRHVSAFELQDWRRPISEFESRPTEATLRKVKMSASTGWNVTHVG